MKKFKLELNDNENKIVSEKELNEIISECMEFDGFLGFTFKEIKE